MPRVLNCKRDGLPAGAVYMGRKMWRYGLPESKWANPFKPRRRTREELERIIAEYERHLRDSGLINDVRELRGRDLICWCAPAHDDLLLRLSNE